MNITIISVGKIKEKYINGGIKEFTKRLSGYCNLKIIEVKDESTKEDMSETEKNILKDKEGERILCKIPSDSYMISLCIEGRQLSSEELSKNIDKLTLMGKSKIIFIIGGSVGLSNKVIKRSDMKLSFSKMTFPHQLMRLILLEQIYRSFRISRGEPYHK
ncbi:23S rRNA (pseudouridine(1915)-N(3))-methyltransferase RlmH [Clostridium sp. D2Q-14]|uniref:23S rRNA (pseudouridine(1915)-N(3))-methyltransferase RlmH n=1 Tax=Anaeromonas gelatinilytica TaxID=2683194 RepID=UPI00193C2F48|nr:23S rRNA (pseudouridine(1915)-N(3))-methyltransferase RlmH [Anaeromonas gelatinilytica]MBS4534487.1 23S rRNA (pseudouridine(1915)-N(3))-methyltransferase RlmH [Anaeromonas gelatinilytica]